MREGVGARSCFFAALKRELGLWEQQQIRGRIPNEVHWDHPEQRLARKKSFCASFCNPLFHSVFATILQTSAHTMFNGGETRLEEIQRRIFSQVRNELGKILTGHYRETVEKSSMLYDKIAIMLLSFEYLEHM